MANSSSFDPVASWQQFVSQWERQVNDLAQQFSSRQEFAGPLNQLAKLSVSARKTFDEAAEKTAESLQLPTQAQMREVIERLDRIEDHLRALTAALSAGGASAAPRTAPRRTRRPPGEKA